jgi:hypothetical protein
MNVWTIVIRDDTTAMQNAPATQMGRVLRRLASDFEMYGGPLATDGNLTGTWPLRDSAGEQVGAVTLS